VQNLAAEQLQTHALIESLVGDGLIPEWANDVLKEEGGMPTVKKAGMASARPTNDDYDTPLPNGYQYPTPPSSGHANPKP